MPIPLLPLVSLGLAGAEAGIGFSQSKKNRKAQEEQNLLDREWQGHMYHVQRQDALADFRMANEYNSPEEQMNRLRQAGLSPHLVYGKGADMAAAQIRGSAPSSSSQIAPKMDWNPNLSSTFTNTLATFQQMKQSQAATDNLYQQIELSKKDSILREAQTAETLQRTARGKFDLAQADRLKDLVYEKAVLENELTDTNIEFQIDENQRRALANSANVQKTLIDIQHEKLKMAKTKEEIAQIQQNIELLSHTREVKLLEEELADQGVLRGDNMFYRLFMMGLDKLKQSLGIIDKRPIYGENKQPR